MPSTEKPNAPDGTNSFPLSILPPVGAHALQPPRSPHRGLSSPLVSPLGHLAATNAVGQQPSLAGVASPSGRVRPRLFRRTPDDVQSADLAPPSSPGSVVLQRVESSEGFYEVLQKLIEAHEASLATARGEVGGPLDGSPSQGLEAAAVSVHASPKNSPSHLPGSCPQCKLQQDAAKALQDAAAQPRGQQDPAQTKAQQDSQPIFLSSATSGDLSSIFKLRRVWDEESSEDQNNAHPHYSFSFTPRVKLDAPSSGAQEHLIEGMSCMQPFLLHPSSWKRLAWDLVSMVFLAYDIIMIPFFEAFNPTPAGFTTIMNYIIMLFWTVDMVASMLTGYQDGKDTVVEPRRIWKRYLTTWFWLDGVIVGLDWSLFALNSSNPGRSSAARLGRSLRTLRFARTLRLIRLLKAKRILLEIQDQINTEALSITFRILKIVLILMLANHVVACSWYYIGVLGTERNEGQLGPKGELSSWILVNRMEDKPLAYLYVTSLHWSLTQFTPASMEVVPENTGERVFAVVVLVLAMITFSSFVSILTASMAELRNLSNDETRQFWLLRRYLRDWQVSRRFTLRLQRYLEYAYHKQRQRVQAKDVKLLALLSGPLHDELKAETLSVHLVTHPLFRSANRSLHVFSRSLSDMYLCRGDCAFTYGERGSSMLFVYTGVFDYQPGENSLAHQQHVGEGRWIAEAVLWTNWLHLGDLEAVTDGQVISIDSRGFGEAMLMYQPAWLAFRSYGQRLVEAMNSIDRSLLTDLLHLVLPPQEIVDSSGFEKAYSMHPMDEDQEPPLFKIGRTLYVWMAAPLTWFRPREDIPVRGKDQVEQRPSFDGLGSADDLRSSTDSERLP